MSPVFEQLHRRPFGLVVSGEATRHEEVIRRLLGPEAVVTHVATSSGQVLEMVRCGQANAVVMEGDQSDYDLLRTLRMIRRVDAMLPVVLVAREVSRHFLEDALRLSAFSVAHKPLEREELLMQLRRVFERFYGLG